MLVIPDIHGRPFWIPAKDYKGEIIFLGDYSDPYGRDFTRYARFRGWGSAEGVIKNMRDIFQFARENQDHVTVLIGNHCFHYIADVEKSSRYDEANADAIKAVYMENMDILKVAKLVGNTLFTHAGVFREWIDLRLKDAKTPQQIEQQLNELLQTPTGNGLFDCGPVRGGKQAFSGPLWADHTDVENKYYTSPIPLHYYDGCAQVFGHTQQYEEGTMWSSPDVPCACIDSRRIFEIDPYLAPKEVIASLKVWGEVPTWTEILGGLTPDEIDEGYKLDEDGILTRTGYWI